MTIDSTVAFDDELCGDDDAMVVVVTMATQVALLMLYLYTCFSRVTRIMMGSQSRALGTGARNLVPGPEP